MGRRFTEPSPPGAPGAAVGDAHWTGERRTAIGAAGLLLTALLTVDMAAGHLTGARSALWAGLAFLLFVILLPARVSAAPGRLTARELLVEHTVRTDALVSIRWCDGVAQRMILRDADGHRVEIDPNVLVRNPALWYRLDTDTRGSVERGTPLCGTTALRQFAERIDRDTARTVFDISSLD